MPTPGAPSDAVQQFLQVYWQLAPVTATFAGLTAHDAELPDWSPDGVAHAVSRWTDVAVAARQERGPHARPIDTCPLPVDVADADRLLAEAAARLAVEEFAEPHGPTGNPALVTGEAIFGLISVLARPDMSANDRAANGAARLHGVAELLAGVRESVAGRAIPVEWSARALRECEAGVGLLAEGVRLWTLREQPDASWAECLLAATTPARSALHDFARWLRDDVPAASRSILSSGATRLSRRVRLAHWVTTDLDELRREASDALAEAVGTWEAMSRASAPGSWRGVLAALDADVPTRADYLERLAVAWQACRALNAEHQLVTWPDAMPVAFAEVPAWVRMAAPALYYLNYRCPPPYAPPTLFTHQVAALPEDADAAERVLRAMTPATITLNHIVHHAGLGHHVQNWHAAHAPSRLGQMAAQDGACRTALLAGGTLAEGWACYAVDLADALGFLTPLERVVQQHTRVRILARAVVDLSLHGGDWSLEDAIHFYQTTVEMSAEAARAEAVKNSMFPGGAVMYWLGTRGVHAAIAEGVGRGHSRRAVHDAVLAYGALPVPMIAQLMRSRA